MKDFIMRILKSAEGDDLERAQLAFRGWSNEALDKPYGYSGKTPRQILDEYFKERTELKAAQEWLDKI